MRQYWLKPGAAPQRRRRCARIWPARWLALAGYLVRCGNSSTDTPYLLPRLGSLLWVAVRETDPGRPPHATLSSSPALSLLLGAGG